MKLTFILLLVSTMCFSQVEKFSQGYVIDKNDLKTACLLENLYSYSTPQTLKVKDLSGGNARTLGTEELKEFGIEGKKRFIKEKVKIDRPKNVVLSWNRERNPDWNEETLFLEVLLEGKASLYHYVDKKTDLMFFKVEGKEVQQLIYRTYMAINNSPGVNNDFRQQLFNEVNCGNKVDEDLRFMPYKTTELLKFFRKFNQCSGSQIRESGTDKRNAFSYKVTTGLNVSRMKARSPFFAAPSTFDFGNNAGFRIGFETEYFLRRKNNKWSFFIEPNYQRLKVNKQFDNREVNLTYNLVELPMGLRHHIFLKDKRSSIFLNGGMMIDLRIKTDMEIEGIGNVPINSWYNFILGAGFNYKRKASLEARFNAYDDLTKNNQRWWGYHKGFSLVLAVPLNKQQ